MELASGEPLLVCTICVGQHDIGLARYEIPLDKRQTSAVRRDGHRSCNARKQLSEMAPETAELIKCSLGRLVLVIAGAVDEVAIVGEG
jgi:hypothetical protein